MAKKKNKAVAVSYDFLGNPIEVPQDYNDFYNTSAPQQGFQPIAVDVGNHQTVMQGLNTGSNYNNSYLPFFAVNQNSGPDPIPPSYSMNQDGSFTINTDYINQNLTGGKRGMDAYGTYDRNTNRPYAYEGIYGNRNNLNQTSIFEDGGSLSPSKAKQILKDGKINGKKITEKQRKYFGAVSNQANNGIKFEDLPKMPDGGVIQVDSRNDPRYKAYQDSLSLYNSTAPQIQRLKDRISGFDNEGNNEKKYMQGPLSSFNTWIEEDVKYYNKLHPSKTWFGVKHLGTGETEALYPMYKKPVQPVEVRPAPEPLPMAGFYGVNSDPQPQIDKLEWDTVVDKGVFPVYGQDNNLQGSWDKGPNGETYFYPISDGQNVIPKGLPSNTQVRSSAPRISNPRRKKADNGMVFNNPFTDDRQFNYGSSPDYMRYANQGPNQPLPPLQQASYQMMPIDNTPPQAQSISTSPSSQQPASGSNYGSIAGGIQSGVEAVGDLFSGINDLRNQVIMGGGTLINGLLKDQHNLRNKPPMMADQTLAYQPQYNNMMENGGNMQSPNLVVNTSYQPGQELEMTPEEIQTLKKAGYEFEILE